MDYTQGKAKSRFKDFSWVRWGDDAFQLACDYREIMVVQNQAILAEMIEKEDTQRS
ncbi:hypothetical protein [uncultured Endozoicomonas sp.]|uniref:hypothetical protein n=1 Tax=uncultured Endozoicomonas sp. TaxID=432652 RepID=UPI00260F9E74|nr:hypothetical protein [uncultured Endozoicomonas sp.]